MRIGAFGPPHVVAAPRISTPTAVRIAGVLTIAANYLVASYYVVRGIAFESWTLPALALAFAAGHAALDLVTLFSHWTFDNYFSPKTPIVGRTVAFFREHHDPATHDEMLKRDFVDGNFENALVGLVWMVAWLPPALTHASWMRGELMVFIASGGGLATFITQIHKWAHVAEPGRFARGLARAGLIVRREFHEAHHADHRRNYGLCAGWWDAVIDRLRVFEALELAIWVACGRVAVESRLGLQPAPEISGAGRLRKASWFLWYGALAWYGQRRHARFDCMNWGYDDGALDLSGALPSAQAAERFPLQLYHAVVGPVPLAGRIVVDASCGRGGGIAYVFDSFAPSEAIGMDLQPANVAIARRTLGPGRPGLAFRAGDAERMPLGDASADAVLSVEASHCYASRERFLAEARRVLRRRGWLLWADFAPQEVMPSIRKAAGALFEVEADLDISAAVVRSMERDGPRRRGLIERHAPRLLHGVLEEFAAADRRTSTYQRFTNGSYVYFLLRLRVSETS